MVQRPLRKESPPDPLPPRRTPVPPPVNDNRSRRSRLLVLAALAGLAALVLLLLW